MTISIVATTAQLIAALNGSIVGDTIELAPGVYSNVNISGRMVAGVKGISASQITIKSEDPNNLAVLTDLNINNSQGIAFQSLNFSTATDAIGPYGAGSTIPFSVNRSGNIAFWNVQVSGSPTGTLANTLSGMIITSSSYVSVRGSSFSYLHEGLAHLSDSYITINGNSFTNLYDDGVRGGGTSNISITNNTFTNLHFDPTDTEHPDAIQFWTAGTTTSASNITVTGNTYTRGTGGAVQGIFMADEVGNLPYYNVNISSNTLTGTQWNGIAVYHALSGNIDYNKLSSYSDYTSEINVYNSSNLFVENNSAGAYNYNGSTGLTLLNNVIVGPSSGAPGTDSPLSFALNARVSSFDDSFDDAPASPAPEPQSWTMMALGMAALGWCLRAARLRPMRRASLAHATLTST